MWLKKPLSNTEVNIAWAYTYASYTSFIAWCLLNKEKDENSILKVV
jgi:hypothetical protein